jgi:hypothetical protein
MAKEEKNDCCADNKNMCKVCPKGNGGGAVYGFGLIGALVYYLSHAGSFGAVLLGILKSLVWPAMFVYHIFTYLKL